MFLETGKTNKIESNHSGKVELVLSLVHDSIKKD